MNEADRTPAGPAWREQPRPIEHHPEFATLIANPRAGRGRVEAELPAVEAAMRANGLAYRLDRTSGPGDAARLAAEALARGERLLVAVGGDGTAGEVLNAMLDGDRPAEPDAVLAVVAANSGCDVVRTFGLPQEPQPAVSRLLTGSVYEIDVGTVTVSTGTGERRRAFLNVAEVGLGGAAAAAKARLPGFLGGARTFLGYWEALARSRRTVVRLSGDAREFEGRITNLLVANLQYTGNGMLVAPRAWPEDGYLDLQVYTGPRSDSFTLLPKMFQGEHLPHPNVLELRSRRLRVEGPRALAVQADGEFLGHTPATFECLPRVLRFKI